jgi:glycerophosphoryl diester phosphodiesterase
MNYARIRAFIDKHITKLGSFLIVAVAAAAVTGAIFQPVQDLLTSSRVFEVLIIGLLLEITMRLVELKETAPGIEVAENQRSAMPDLVRHVRETRPPTVQLFEFSSLSIRDLLASIMDSGATAQMLMHDPYQGCINELQRKVIESQILTLESGSLGDTARLELRFYSTPAALRGRRLGTVLNVGWYTYFQRSDGTPDLLGSQNAMITVDARSFAQLADYFDQQFRTAWATALTLDRMLAASPVESAPLLASLTQLRQGPAMP